MISLRKPIQSLGNARHARSRKLRFETFLGSRNQKRLSLNFKTAFKTPLVYHILAKKRQFVFSQMLPNSFGQVSYELSGEGSENTSE